MLTTKRPVLSEASDPSENVQTAFRKPSVIIVGGGFCGAALAINLLRKAQRPLQVVLVEPRPALGQGVAYNTGDPLHLLNVPADNMSAFVDDSGHFQDWLARQAGVLGPFFQADGGSFLPRYVYGQYIRDTLETSVEKARPSVTFASIQAEVSELEPAPQGMRVRLTNGRTLDANAVVLALGNLPPRALPHIPTELAQTGRYQADPWGGGVLEGLNANDDLLIVGTGLTMVDLVVSLHSRGHRGRIYALSRRRLLPQAHPPRSRCDSPVLHPFVTELEQNPPRTISTLLRKVRAAVKTHTHHGGEWQEAVDSLRPISPLLWRSLGEAEKMRYLSRVRPYWEAHRHRIAPQVADTVNVCRGANQLRVLTGQLRELKLTAEGVEVNVSKRDGSRDKLHVTRVVNATGPETDLLLTSHRLLRSLLAAGYIEPDTTGLGFKVGPSGQVLGTETLPLYALGALRRNESYEGTAVPELRQQAYDLAQNLVEALTSNLETPLRIRAST